MQNTQEAGAKAYVLSFLQAQILHFVFFVFFSFVLSFSILFCFFYITLFLFFSSFVFFNLNFDINSF